MLSFSDLLICLNVLAIILRKEATVDIYFRECTIASKINGTSKGVYLPVSKLHSILAIANLLAQNNRSQIYYCGQISLQSSFSDNLTLLGVTFILLAMYIKSFYYLQQAIRFCSLIGKNVVSWCFRMCQATALLSFVCTQKANLWKFV